MVEMLFEQQKSWAAVRGQAWRLALSQFARLAGMTSDEFEKCMNDKKLAEGLLAKRREYAEKYQIRSTPTFVIGSQRVSGAMPFAAFEKIIEPMLKKAN